MLNGTVRQIDPSREPESKACDEEPIRTPGCIQPHGVLFVVHEVDLTILQVSENVEELFDVPMNGILGYPLYEVLGRDLVKAIETELARIVLKERPVLLMTTHVPTSVKKHLFNVIVHRSAEGLQFDLEVTPEYDGPADFFLALDEYARQTEIAGSLIELSQMTAAKVREMTGFDRVLIYQFDEWWNGTVIGENRNDRLPSYFHHRFLASDIPPQARELYRVNRYRLIPDACYEPAAIQPALNPITGRPVDLTFSVLRSVSPIHLEYMKNMETAASMSVSILKEGRLWGLIACHHRTPRFVSFAVRRTCDLIGQTFSQRLAVLDLRNKYESRIEVRTAYAKLLAAMADRLDIAASLLEHPTELLTVAGAQGAAVLSEGGCALVGQAPAEPAVRRLADWLFREIRQDVYCTDSLPGVYPEAEAFKDRACGLLAASVSKLHPSYVLWFRPELLQTIKWGGNPHQTIDQKQGDLYLHPRRSFATWLETVKLRSIAWTPGEIEAASELRNAIVGVVLRRAEELAELNLELTRSNKELEAFSYSVSHDLRAPLRHAVGYAELLRENASDRLTSRDRQYIETIIESSHYAGILVDKLLAFARLGRGELQRMRVDMDLLIRESQREVMANVSGRKITWKIANVPAADADPMMIRLAVRNLLENAVKYTRGREEAVIEVGSRNEGNEVVYFVRDNGAGFDMKYVDKLFGVFQRLHRMEDYEGTGIGLANVRRVLSRHGGRTWAEGEEGAGATFYFSLPRQNR